MFNIFYNPLEQFEPIPFIVLFPNEVNLSITNVTIIFIYIVLILGYFLNGYIFLLNNKKKMSLSSVEITNLRQIPASVNGIENLNYFDKIYGGSLEKNAGLLSHKNKVVPYMYFLARCYSLHNFIQEEKGNWFHIPLNIFASIKHQFSIDFYKGFYFLLKNKKVSFDRNFMFFSNIKFYIKGFIIFLYSGIVKNKVLYNTFRLNSKLFNTIYNFITGNIFVKHFIPNFNIFFFENVYNFILNMVKESIGGDNRESIKFFPFVFTLFIFIIMCNLVGLIPYSSTITSYLIITLALAVMVLVGVNIIAARKHGIKFFGHFLPAGCPFALYPLLIPIEFISYIFRVVSLSVRLFANMMAGHTLLAVLAGFGWVMATSSIALFVIYPLPVFVVFVLVFLETAVACIQAYVFTILTCLYLDEAINMH